MLYKADYVLFDDPLIKVTCGAKTKQAIHLKWPTCSLLDDKMASRLFCIELTKHIFSFRKFQVDGLDKGPLWKHTDILPVSTD